MRVFSQLRIPLCTCKWTTKLENNISPEQALWLLVQSNVRYVSGKSFDGDLADIRSRLAGGQIPDVCILSFSDSRTGTEYSFDEGRGVFCHERCRKACQAGYSGKSGGRDGRSGCSTDHGSRANLLRRAWCCGRCIHKAPTITTRRHFLTIPLADAVNAAEGQSNLSDLLRATTELRISSRT